MSFWQKRSFPVQKHKEAPAKAVNDVKESIVKYIELYDEL
ncbi:hypothetical protein AGMMS50233_10930 [Endomicrobiia bacterium]|nr:hypothetical protein AGMMS50233_10930 [Endomicrobiia bacterium]